MNRGDICLAYFPFTDVTGTKLRPILIVSADSFNKGDDLVVVPLSSRIDRERGLVIESTSPHFRASGLKVSSTVKWSKPFTIARSVIARRLGRLHQEAVDDVLRRLRSMFT